MGSPIVPPPADGASGAAGSKSYSDRFGELLDSVSLKIASGTLSLTGVRAWDSAMRQVKVGQNETGSFGLTTAWQTVSDLLIGDQGLGKADPALRDVVGFGPVVMPFEADEVTIKSPPTDVYNDVFTTPFRSLGYGDVLSFGNVPSWFPQVSTPLWVYALYFPVGANVELELVGMDRRTTYEATAVASGAQTIGSLAGTGNLAGAVLASLVSDQEYYWNFGGKWDATIVKTPTGARRVSAGDQAVFADVAWPEE